MRTEFIITRVFVTNLLHLLLLLLYHGSTSFRAVKEQCLEIATLPQPPPPPSILVRGIVCSYVCDTEYSHADDNDLREYSNQRTVEVEEEAELVTLMINHVKHCWLLGSFPLLF